MDEKIKHIIDTVLKEAMPGEAVRNALTELTVPMGRLILVSVGKAAWEMAESAVETLSGRIDEGIVITKYGHSRGTLPGVVVYEAGHPVPDENGYAATEKVLEMTADLHENDTVLFLLSGGGSSLFEKPLIDSAEIEDITRQMLGAGANIVEINTIRKRLSAVKGGKFAQHCMPAHVFTVILSDIINDPPDMIASGPAYPDSANTEQALAIAARYSIRLSEGAAALLNVETPKILENVETRITGSVRYLCRSAEKICQSLGYKTLLLTTSLDCEAREAGRFLAAIAREHQEELTPLAIICGGETVVHLTGKGLGGRNQELVLAAADGISGLRDTVVLSFGSDGTDGPTDAAGGITDGKTKKRLADAGFNISDVLADNDAYHALKAVDGLLMTGPTGTNVNDLSLVLIR